MVICTDYVDENLKTLKTSVEVIEVFDILEGCFYKVNGVNWVNMVYGRVSKIEQNRLWEKKINQHFIISRILV